MKKLIMMVGLFALGLKSFGFSTPLISEAGQVAHKSLHGEIGIHFFHGSWADAKKESDSKNKIIFLDAYASWCGPCKTMARVAFTDEEVGNFFNANFINVKMDMEKNADGPRLSKKFNLTAYPSLYFLDKNEEIVHFALGMHGPKDLIKLGKAALLK